MAITIPILTDFNGKGIDKGVAQFNKLEGAGQKAGFLIKKAALPAAAAIGALGAGALVAAKAAAEDEAAQAKLAGTLERVTGANDAVIASTEKYITQLSQSVGVADDELRPALGKLATATGDVDKALKLLTTALDVSAQTGKPLDTVVTGLAKAYGGNLGALNKLLPGFDQGIIKSKDFTKAQEELSRLTGGAAAANAETAAGKFRTFQITLDETKESIGAALLPVFESFLPVLQRAATFIQNNKDVVVALAGAIAGLSAAVLVINAAMKAFEAALIVVKVATVAFSTAQAALNIVLTANPIGVVVVALGALAAAVVLAYNKSETFRDIVNSIFGWFSKLADFLEGPLKLAFNVFKTYVEVATAPIRVMVTAIQTAINLVERLRNSIIGVGGNPFAGGGTPNFGGTGPTPITGPQRRSMSLDAVPTAAPAGGTVININLSAGLVSTPDQIGQDIIQAIQRAQRRSGAAFVSA